MYCTLSIFQLQQHNLLVTLICLGMYLNFAHAYEKLRYYLKRKRKNYEINIILWKIKQRLRSMS